jgi:hypothetical protein
VNALEDRTSMPEDYVSNLDRDPPTKSICGMCPDPIAKADNNCDAAAVAKPFTNLFTKVTVLLENGFISAVISANRSSVNYT